MGWLYRVDGLFFFPSGLLKIRYSGFSVWMMYEYEYDETAGMNAGNDADTGKV